MLKKMSFFVLMVSVVILLFAGGVQAADCTSSNADAFSFFWDMDIWDCGHYPPDTTDNVYLVNNGSLNRLSVNSNITVASVQWVTPLTRSYQFDITSGNTLTVTGAINLNGTATYPVSFTGTGTFSPATTVYYCSSTTVAGINCQAGGPPAPGYDSSPASGSTISMTTTLGTNGTSTLTVSETGDSTLNVTNITVTGTDATKFTPSPTTFSIADGDPDQSVTVTCDASALGTFTATLNVEHNATGSPATYPLSCTVNAAAAPGYDSSPAPGSTINVGTAATGSPVSTALAVSETGTGALNITSHSLGGTNPGDFSVSPANLNIADGGAAQNLTIQCTPSDAGTRTATLTVNHNASGSPAKYTLNCTGTSGTTLPPVNPPLPPVISGPPLPIAITAEVSNITDSEALSGGEVVYPEGCTALLVGRGIVWDTVSPPTYPQDASTFDGWESGEYTSALTNLLPQTRYYTNSILKCLIRMCF